MNPKKKEMKAFLKALGRMQEEDYVTSDEFYKMFTAVVDAVKKSAINNKGKIEEIASVADKKAVELEGLFATLLKNVEKRMSEVKDGEPGKDGDTPVAGVDYPDYQEIRDFIREQVETLPEPETATDVITVDYIKEKLESLEGNDRLSYESINGIEQFIDEKMRLMESTWNKSPKFVGGGGSGSGGGASTFLELTDTPSAYTANQYVKVNAAGDALELVTLSGGGDMTAAVYDAAGITEQLVGLTASQTLTNKTINADNNTISNIALGAEATGAIGDLSDVTVTTLGTDELLFTQDGSTWINQTLAEAGIQAVLAEGAFVDGDKTKLDGIETGADVTDTANVTAAGALMDSEVDADIKTLSLPASTTISTFGASLVDDADAATARTTLGVDAAGTDNSTDVTLAGTPDYITITGQTITRNQIDLSTDVTGTLPASAGALLDSELTDIAAVKATSDAVASDLNTGTDTAKFITPDALAGSNLGTKSVVVQAEAMATDLAVGDDLATFYIPSCVGGMNLVGVHAYVDTAGTTGTTDIQIHNETQAADMLSTKITIDSTETSSRTAATAAVIDTANDDVAAGDKIRIDVDAVSTTAPKGLFVELEFRLA